MTMEVYELRYRNEVMSKSGEGQHKRCRFSEPQELVIKNWNICTASKRVSTCCNGPTWCSDTVRASTYLGRSGALPGLRGTRLCYEEAPCYKEDCPLAEV